MNIYELNHFSPPHEKSNFISHFMLWLLNSNETGDLEPEKVILGRFFFTFSKIFVFLRMKIKLL